MSPQKPPRTEMDEQALRSAMRKIATRPAVNPKVRVRSVGVAVRQAAIENA